MKIVGDIVCLRLFKETDITETYVSWLNDPEVVKYSNQRFFNHTIESSNNYLKSFKGTNNFYMAIEDKATKELYGSITAYKQTNHNVADIGMLIGNKKNGVKGLV